MGIQRMVPCCGQRHFSANLYGVFPFPCGWSSDQREVSRCARQCAGVAESQKVKRWLYTLFYRVDSKLRHARRGLCLGTLPKIMTLRWCRVRVLSHEKGLRDRNSPTCTLSQNGYGDKVHRFRVATVPLIKERQRLGSCLTCVGKVVR